MIRNIIALLSIINERGEHIDIAKGKHKLPLTWKEFKKYNKYNG
jgi:hypothetical protein